MFSTRAILFGTLVTLLATQTWSAEASFEEAQKLWKSGNEQAAIKMYQTLSEKGDIKAQNTLGTYYFTGLKVEKDQKKAEELWTLACDGGMWQACTNMALMMVQRGDFEAAERMYRHNAEHYNDRGAMNNLVKLYRNPDWKGRSEQKAKEWEKKLAAE